MEHDGEKSAVRNMKPKLNLVNLEENRESCWGGFVRFSTTAWWMLRSRTNVWGSRRSVAFPTRQPSRGGSKGCSVADPAGNAHQSAHEASSGPLLFARSSQLEHGFTSAIDPAQTHLLLA